MTTSQLCEAVVAMTQVYRGKHKNALMQKRTSARVWTRNLAG